MFNYLKSSSFTFFSCTFIHSIRFWLKIVIEEEKKLPLPAHQHIRFLTFQPLKFALGDSDKCKGDDDLDFVKKYNYYLINYLTIIYLRSII